MIRLKKYLNPHENSCSKVISILTTGNILHESSSAPRQHKSVQYKWFTLYLHRDVSHTDMLNPHFISCRGVSGAGGNMRESRIFCQFYLVLSLFYSLQRGPNGFIAEKTLLIIYQGCKGVHYFPGRGGGCQTFSTIARHQEDKSSKAISLSSPYTYLLFSRGGGGVSEPPIPLWIRTCAMSS